MDQQTQAKVNEIAEKITQADKQYYDAQGVPTLSDDEYDVLKDELEKLSPEHPLLKKVGETPAGSGIWAKRSHQIPMGSLKKVKGSDGIKEWWTKTAAMVR